TQRRQEAKTQRGQAVPQAEPGLTQRRRGTQRFAESSFSLRFSAFLCVSALSSSQRAAALTSLGGGCSLCAARPGHGANHWTQEPAWPRITGTLVPGEMNS